MLFATLIDQATPAHERLVLEDRTWERLGAAHEP